MAMHRDYTPKIRVRVLEYELGCGSKIIEELYFDTEAEAKQYCREFNKSNTKPEAPDWYMVAVIE